MFRLVTICQSHQIERITIIALYLRIFFQDEKKHIVNFHILYIWLFSKRGH